LELVKELFPLIIIIQMINEIPTISDADGDDNLEECLNNIHLLLENETIIVDILLSSQQVFFRL
jgi:hypothetical protein